MGLWAVFKLLGRLLSSLFKPRVSDHTSFQNSGMSENTTVALQDGSQSQACMLLPKISLSPTNRVFFSKCPC